MFYGTVVTAAGGEGREGVGVRAERGWGARGVNKQTSADDLVDGNVLRVDLLGELLQRQQRVLVRARVDVGARARCNGNNNNKHVSEWLVLTHTRLMGELRAALATFRTVILEAIIVKLQFVQLSEVKPV